MQLEVATAVNTIAKVGGVALLGIPVLGQVVGIKELDQSMLVQPLFWVGLAVLTLLALSSRIVLWKLKSATDKQLIQDSHTNLAFATKDDVILQLRAEQAAKDAEIARLSSASAAQAEERIASLTRERDAAIKRADRVTDERDTYFKQAAMMTLLLKMHNIPRPEFTRSRIAVADDASSITTTLEEESDTPSILEEISEDML